MSQLTAEQRRLLSDRFDRNAAAARVGGKPSSEYFLDKCGAEAGDTYEPQQSGRTEQDVRSPWHVLLGDSWIGRLLKF